MPTITLNYGTGSPITVPCQRAGQAQPRRAGGKTNSFGGAEDSDIRAELMVIPLILAPKTLTEAAAIRALVALGAQFPCRGDVFLNGGATTVICSGKLSDDLDQTATWVTINLTLFEIGTLTYSRPPEVFLANLADDDTGTFKKAWTTRESGFANYSGIRILNAATLTTCGGLPDPGVNCPITYTDPGTPEISWLSTAFLANGNLVGAPTVRFQSTGGTGDKWQAQGVKAKLTLLRGVTVIGTTETAYGDSNGGFSSGQITLDGATGLILAGLIGDRVKLDVFGRVGLHGGYTDGNDGVSDLNRQTITYGYTGAGDYYSALQWGELAYLLDPSLRP